MTGARTWFRVDDREVRSDIARFSKQISDMAPAMKAFGEYMLLETDDRFSAEKSPSGTAWAPLSPKTLRYKRTSKILTESGLLRAVAYSAGPKRMAYGTNRIYGAIHQFGGMAGRGGRVPIPARPFLGINAADQAEFRDILIDHLEKR